MRFAAYAGASVTLATGVFLKALHQRSNFYSACVYLSQSSANLMILTNLCLLVAGFLLFWLQRLLYGPLRPIETEQLYEKAWFAVTETCLAMTIFRGELGGWFLVMFICLLVGKVWGWIGEGRVEYLEQQPPANPRLFHTRLSASLALSVLFNSFMLRYCVHTVLDQARPDMMVMFGFEFAVLSILSFSTTARYGISLVETYVTQQQMRAKIEERRAEIGAARQQNQQGEDGPPADMPDEHEINEMELDIPGWEEKGRWIFYLDLVTDFFKLIVYLTFFAILFTFYGLPIHILRDVILTIRSFARRIMDFIRFRNATRDMNDQYRDATADEVSREDVCIICREEMTPWPQEGQAGPGARRVPERLRPKKLPCGHVLHFTCLRSWLERQQNCPICRRPVVVPRNRGEGGAGVQQNAGGQNPLQPNGAPRARIYQFGPFRIGFGAGRGDLFQNLHQQIRQGNAPLQQPANANLAGARQIGFGFGFGRRPLVPTPAAMPAPVPAAPTPTAAPAGQPTDAPGFLSIQAQLLQIERQILQELDSLNLSMQQVQAVRLLQAELQRLRDQQRTGTTGDLQAEVQRLRAQQATGTAGLDLQGAALQQPPQFPLSLTPTPSAVPPSRGPRHEFTSTRGVPPIPAGDARLPQGLTLPEGWSLIPLRPTGQTFMPDGQTVVPTGQTSTLPTGQTPNPTDQSSSQTTAPTATEPLLSQSESSLSPIPQPPAQRPSESRSAATEVEDPENQDRHDETVEEHASSTAHSLPNWGSGPATESVDRRPESTRGWTNFPYEPSSQNVEGPSTATGEEQQPEEAEASTSESSKGKGRLVTVEDADDDEK